MLIRRYHGTKVWELGNLRFIPSCDLVCDLSQLLYLFRTKVNLSVYICTAPSATKLFSWSGTLSAI